MALTRTRLGQSVFHASAIAGGGLRANRRLLGARWVAAR